jgi:RHS repeat-associated protein
VNSSGSIATKWSYEPYGVPTPSGSSSGYPYLFAGMEYDPTGLYHTYARYYSPRLQRFITEDPLQFDGDDINLFAYEGNSPVNVIDPLGEDRAFREGIIGTGDASSTSAAGVSQAQTVTSQAGAVTITIGGLGNSYDERLEIHATGSGARLNKNKAWAGPFRFRDDVRSAIGTPSRRAIFRLLGGRRIARGAAIRFALIAGGANVPNTGVISVIGPPTTAIDGTAGASDLLAIGTDSSPTPSPTPPPTPAPNPGGPVPSPAPGIPPIVIGGGLPIA